MKRTAIAIATMIAAIALAWFLSRAGSGRTTWTPWIPDKMPTMPEKVTQVILGLFGIITIGAAVLTVVFAYTDPQQLAALLHQPVMLVGTADLLWLSGVCALVAVSNVRRYPQMVIMLVLASALVFIACALALLGMKRFGEADLTAQQLLLVIAVVFIRHLG